MAGITQLQSTLVPGQTYALSDLISVPFSSDPATFYPYMVIGVGDASTPAIIFQETGLSGGESGAQPFTGLWPGPAFYIFGDEQALGKYAGVQLYSNVGLFSNIKAAPTVDSNEYTLNIEPYPFLTWQLHGAPQIASTDKQETASLTLVEDSTGNISTAPATGIIHFTDSDTSQQPTGSKSNQTATLTNYDGSTGQLTASQTSALENAFTISAASGNTNSGAINWTYNPDGTALDFLSAGQTAVVTSTVQVTGQNGTGDTATVTVTVHGFAIDYWTGKAGTTDWNTAGNWTQGVPTSASEVVIGTASANVTLNQNATVNSLDIKSGNTLTVGSGESLTISSVASSALTVESGAQLTLVSNADLLVAGATSGGGSITIGSGALLQLVRQASGITINFAGMTGTLE